MAQPFIPPKTAQLIRSLGITESRILDVYDTGIKREGQNKIYKKYPSNTIQVTYAVADSGENIITWVSKW